MSSPIMPAQGLSGPPIEDPRTRTDIGDVGAFMSELASGVSALSVDAGRGGPPPEVLDQILAAGRIGEQLRDGGHEVRFFAPADGGHVRIEVHDRDGNTLAALSAAAAMELATGSPLN
jgi:hypothetical protein